jgi:hypothetical protein
MRQNFKIKVDEPSVTTNPPYDKPRNAWNLEAIISTVLETVISANPPSGDEQFLTSNFDMVAVESLEM